MNDMALQNSTFTVPNVKSSVIASVTVISRFGNGAKQWRLVYVHVPLLL